MRGRGDVYDMFVVRRFKHFIHVISTHVCLHVWRSLCVFIIVLLNKRNLDAFDWRRESRIHYLCSAGTIHYYTTKETEEGKKFALVRDKFKYTKVENKVF